MLALYGVFIVWCKKIMIWKKWKPILQNTQRASCRRKEIRREIEHKTYETHAVATEIIEMGILENVLRIEPTYRAKYLRSMLYIFSYCARMQTKSISSKQKLCSDGAHIHYCAMCILYIPMCVPYSIILNFKIWKEQPAHTFYLKNFSWLLQFLPIARELELVLRFWRRQKLNLII